MSSTDGGIDVHGRFMRHGALARIGSSRLAMLSDGCDEEELPFLRCHLIGILGFTTLLEALEEAYEDIDLIREEERRTRESEDVENLSEMHRRRRKRTDCRQCFCDDWSRKLELSEDAEDNAETQRRKGEARAEAQACSCSECTRKFRRSKKLRVL